MLTKKQKDVFAAGIAFCTTSRRRVSKRGVLLGRQILSHIVAQALNQGRTTVVLDVVTDNSNALGLYQSCGFDVTAEHRYFEKRVTQ